MSDHTPIVIGFYTEGTSYEVEIRRMVASTKAFGYETAIYGYESLGGWQVNCYHKPALILRAMDGFEPGTPLLYLDADAEIVQRPVLIEELCDNQSVDLGVVYTDWSKYATMSKDNLELTSAMIYMRNTPGAREVVSRWLVECERALAEGSDLVDDRHFQTVLDGDISDIVVVRKLPDTYSQIFDFMASGGGAVIRQHQASRRFKEEVGA